MPPLKPLLLLASLTTGIALAEGPVASGSGAQADQDVVASHPGKGPVIAAATPKSPLRAPPSEPFEHETSAPGSGKPYSMRIAEPHAFSVEEARARLHFLLDYWTQRFGVKQEWHGGDLVYVTGWVLGIRVEARVHVQGHRIWAVAVDPGPIMRRTAERYIRGKLAKYMHPTYRDP